MDPITVEMAMLGKPSMMAATAVVSSGRVVPNETTVAPMSTSSTPKAWAIYAAPSVIRPAAKSRTPRLAMKTTASSKAPPASKPHGTCFRQCFISLTSRDTSAMIYEKIPTMPTAQELIDKAFKRATRAGGGKRNRRDAQESMVMTAGNILHDNLENMVRRWPNFDEIPRFYREITDVVVGVDELRQSLASAQWAARQVKDISRQGISKIRGDADPVQARKEAFGRMASILRRVDKDMRLLGEARDKLRKLPDVREDEPTIVVAGYPNVGKSSFVSLVTGARPEIARYPFTTKGIAIGHYQRDDTRYQVVDTPGLLDRPISERNDIELQAILALQHLGDVILFILDPSETSGYPMEDQERLLEEMRRTFTIPIIAVANKSDLLEEEAPYPRMSTLNNEGVQEVFEDLIDIIGVEEEEVEYELPPSRRQR